MDTKATSMPMGPTGSTITNGTMNVGPTGVTSPADSSRVPQEKKLVLEHVLYEMHMFLWTSGELNKLLACQLYPSHLYDAMYIAHKCSMRNLLEFFSSENKENSNTDIYFGKFYKIEKSKESDIENFNDEQLNSHKMFQNDHFDKFFPDIDGRQYFKVSNKFTIKSIVNKTISHLTDKRFDWGSENYEEVINSPTVHNRIVHDIKEAIKDFLNCLQNDYGNINLYYIYCTNKCAKNKYKNLTDELKNNIILDLIADIKKLL